MRLFYGWVMVGLSFLAMMLASGSTYTFGLLIKPVTEEMGWSRASLSLAMSIFLFAYGFSSAPIGKLVDRLGPRLVIAFFLLVMASGSMMVGGAAHLWQFYLFFGLLVAVGYAGTTVLPTSVLLSSWFEKRCGLAMGIASTGYSAGQLLVVPISFFILMSYGWRFSYLPLGTVMVALSLLVFILVRNKPSDVNAFPDGDEMHRSSLTQRAEEVGVEFMIAMRTKVFWFVSLAYLACGFTDFLITTHIAPFASDMGFGPSAGAYALSILGGANILGLLAAGRASDKVGPATTLAFIYLIRWISLLLLLFVRNVYMLYLFAFIFGFTFFTTAPLTSTFVRETFGKRTMGSIFGVSALIHHASGGVGVFFGGLVFDVTKSYFSAFLTGSFLVLMATILCLLIKEHPYAKL